MKKHMPILVIFICIVLIMTHILFDLQTMIYPLLARTVVAVASLAIWYFFFYLVHQRKRKVEND